MIAQKGFLVAAATAAFTSSTISCPGVDAPPPLMESTRKVREVLLNPSAMTVEVSNVLRQLTATKIDFGFLAQVFNDSRFPNEHRRLCFFAMARSLGRSGRTLSEFAALLDHPKWIREQDIHECWALTGYLPVTLETGGDVVTIEIFPETEKHSSCICLSFLQPVGKNMVFRALHGDRLAPSEDVQFKEIGLIEAGVPDPNHEALDRWLKENPQTKRPSR
jgi:hypothetical protein